MDEGAIPVSGEDEVFRGHSECEMSLGPWGSHLQLRCVGLTLQGDIWA